MNLVTEVAPIQVLILLIEVVLLPMIWKMWRSIEINNASHGALRELLAREYLPRLEYEKDQIELRKDLRDDLQKIREDVTPLKGKVAVLEERTQLSTILEKIHKRLEERGQ